MTSMTLYPDGGALWWPSVNWLGILTRPVCTRTQEVLSLTLPDRRRWRLSLVPHLSQDVVFSPRCILSVGLLWGFIHTCLNGWLFGSECFIIHVDQHDLVGWEREGNGMGALFRNTSLSSSIICVSVSVCVCVKECMFVCECVWVSVVRCIEIIIKKKSSYPRDRLWNNWLPM